MNGRRRQTSTGHPSSQVFQTSNLGYRRSITRTTYPFYLTARLKMPSNGLTKRWLTRRRAAFMGHGKKAAAAVENSDGLFHTSPRKDGPTMPSGRLIVG